MEGWEDGSRAQASCKDSEDQMSGCCASTSTSSPATNHKRTSKTLLREASDALSALGVEFLEEGDVGSLTPLLLVLILVAADEGKGLGSADAAAEGMEALVPHGRDRFPLLVREAKVLGDQFSSLVQAQL